ncbi:alpha/beta hydrolase [Streptomyces sp. SP17BM10]|uniref:alpha/beta fold hydrolase n=1 Tax=Streptomyces sp. SP17BM10 TaxID=3002530 RepID=UPI002E77C2D9|nr:alpha/beta hydrolase [Streptomyces sp. SP17BM10]MEE1786572.1 alpha/beta hydrolase [Streptomyces sp. SP17BM10]
MTWTEHIVERDGVRLSCRDWGGPGTPVVLLHGLAGHAGEWDAVARSLSRRHRVVAVDQRGHGAATRRPGDVSRTAYVADVVAVVEQLDLHRPVLVGQSLGGHTAMLTAAAHPALPGGLVLVEAGAGSPSPDLPTAIGAALDAWPKPFPSRGAAVEFFGGGAVGEAWAGGLEERDGGWWPRFEWDVMVGSLAELARRSSWDEWTSITCPALVVLGQSGVIPREEAETMLRLRPETEAMSIPAAGHDVHLEQPDPLCRALYGFLDQVDGGRSPEELEQQRR